MSKIFKKMILLFIFVSILCFICGCGIFHPKIMRTIKIEGIENFEKGQSDMSINQSLLPSDDFLESFSSVDTDYYYYSHYNTLFPSPAIQCSIVICKYNETDYEKAKAFCLQRMELSSENKKEYNGYVFLEDKRMKEFSDFPHWFNYLVYNDNQCDILFMGFFEDYNYDGYKENMQLAREDWGTFLVNNFGEFYDFNK